MPDDQTFTISSALLGRVQAKDAQAWTLGNVTLGNVTLGNVTLGSSR